MKKSQRNFREIPEVGMVTAESRKVRQHRAVAANRAWKPDEDTQAEMYEESEERLEAAGYAKSLPGVD